MKYTTLQDKLDNKPLQVASQLQPHPGHGQYIHLFSCFITIYIWNEFVIGTSSITKETIKQDLA